MHESLAPDIMKAVLLFLLASLVLAINIKYLHVTLLRGMLAMERRAYLPDDGKVTNHGLTFYLCHNVLIAKFSKLI